jgi:hypothetical protein
MIVCIIITIYIYICIHLKIISFHTFARYVGCSESNLTKKNLNIFIVFQSNELIFLLKVVNSIKFLFINELSIYTHKISKCWLKFPLNSFRLGEGSDVDVNVGNLRISNPFTHTLVFDHYSVGMYPVKRKSLKNACRRSIIVTCTGMDHYDTACVG